MIQRTSKFSAQGGCNKAQQSLVAVATEEQARGVRLLEARKMQRPRRQRRPQTTDLDAERARETGSSIDLDAERTRNSGRSSTDLEFDKARKQMMIGFKRMRDDDLIGEDEFYAKRKRLLNL